jgi:hypothetical protein
MRRVPGGARIVWALAACAAATVGCEAVLDVDALHYAQDAADATGGDDAGTDATADGSANAAVDATSDATPEAAADVVPDGNGDATVDAGQDSGADATDSAADAADSGASDGSVAGDRVVPLESGSDAQGPDSGGDAGADAPGEAGGDGSVTYTTNPAAIAANANATSVAIADLDGNGTLDLAVSIFGGNYAVDVLPGWGDGTFKAAQGFGGNVAAYAVRIADVNQDTKPDLVLVNGQATSTIQVFINTSTGGVLSFATPVSYNLGPDAGNSNWYSLALGDLNKDGYPDIVATNFGSNNVDVLINNRSGGFGGASSVVVGNGPIGVAIADLNGDGNPDVATANYSDSSVGVLIGNGNGTFQAVSAHPVGTSTPQSLAAADMNGDTKVDLVVNHNNMTGAVSVLLNDGGAGFSKAAGSPFATGGPYEDQIAVADLNGDGHPDVATINFGVCCWPGSGQAGMLSLLFGTGSGALSTAQVFPTVSPSDNLHGVAIGDLDGDGRPDIAVTTKAYHNVFVYLNQ